MSFVSINLIIMEINPWKFGQKQFTTYQFTKITIRQFLIQKFKIIYFDASSPWKLGSNDGMAWMGFNAYDYYGFQQELLA